MVIYLELSLLADFCHLASLLILLYKLLVTKSCTGISGRSQILLATVLIARYLSIINNNDKNAFQEMRVAFTVCAIACTLATVYLIYGKYYKTYDDKFDTFYSEFLPAICLILAFIVNFETDLTKVLRVFSIYLEAVAIVPQLWLTHKMGFTLYMPHYFVVFGYYQALNIVSWILRYYIEVQVDMISTFGFTAQTIIFTIFLYFGGLRDEKKIAVSVIDCDHSKPFDINVSEETGQLLIDYKQHSGNEKADTKKEEVEVVEVKDEKLENFD